MTENSELKCGLEIHQQLNTAKLFCNCPSELRKDKPDFIIKRKLHAVAGETGKIDEAVKHEAMLKKDFEYQGYKDTNCLIELDEEPPEQINNESLKIALQISLLLNCKIIKNTQIMRKTVIDGSNTSGFQRTVLIARDGFIETSQGKIKIDTICLEEDAARIISRTKDKDIYRLDRLGIPLIEIATSPDIKTPSQAKEAALKIGEILRATNVKRGLGTIRQDVNLSVKYSKKQGQRIEIKGFQDIKNIEKTIENEIKRQINLIKQNQSKPEVRNALPDNTTEFLRPLPGKARMYPETDLPLLHISREFENSIRKELPKLRHELKAELEKKGLNQELINILLNYKKIQEFNELMKVVKKGKEELVAKMITIWRKEIASKNDKTFKQIEKKLTTDILETVLQRLEKNQIKESQVKDILEEIFQGKGLGEIFERKEIKEDELEKQIKEIIKQKPNLSINAYMGLIMNRFKGKVDGKKVSEILKKLID